MGFNSGFKGLIPSDFVHCLTAILYKSVETTQGFACHYDLFSQMLRVQKAKSKRTFFRFNTAIIPDV